ncbi:MAG: hypothetical protein KDA68_11240 [Planctomycetaceae bacterium]|nr:hypothetical protein [Planctomycetaceae bacterium]
MSIGPSSPSGYSLPASIVGSAARNLNETSQARNEAAQQNVQAGQAKFSVRDNEDVMETGLSADRDVDGRLPYDAPPEEQQQEEEGEGNEGTSAAQDVHRSFDPDGERGGELDLEA